MNRNELQTRRFLKRIKDDEEGAIGIGTLIVFISMVLVAAIAAAVLIDTAGNLQSRAKRTGEDAVDDVSGGIHVLNVGGEHVGGDIVAIRVYMVLYSGTEPINAGRVGSSAGNLAIYVSATDPNDDETGSDVYVADATGTTSTEWTSDEALVDPHGQFASNGILDQDSIIRITFDVPNIDLGPRSLVHMKFMVGAGGTPTVSTSYTPGTYSAQDNDWLELE